MRRIVGNGDKFKEIPFEREIGDIEFFIEFNHIIIKRIAFGPSFLIGSAHLLCQFVVALFIKHRGEAHILRFRG